MDPASTKLLTNAILALILQLCPSSKAATVLLTALTIALPQLPHNRLLQSTQPQITQPIQLLHPTATTLILTLAKLATVRSQAALLPSKSAASASRTALALPLTPTNAMLAKALTL